MIVLLKKLNNVTFLIKHNVINFKIKKITFLLLVWLKFYLNEKAPYFVKVITAILKVNILGWVF